MPSALCVIIPAHNEARLIGGTLAAVRRQVTPGDEVIVVANGCTDETAQVSRAALDGVDARVLVIEQASKAAALNAGDDAACAAARVYLDADVVISPGLLDSLRQALSMDRAVLAAPRVEFDTSASGRTVRAFYRVMDALAHRSDLVVGGVYAVNGLGRQRFPAFPDLIADDHFAKLHFAPDERVHVEVPIAVVAPADVRNLVKVRTRIVRGNRQLGRYEGALRQRPSTTRQTVAHLHELVRRDPTAAADVLTYVAVVACARVRASLPGGYRWEVDASARRAGG